MLVKGIVAVVLIAGVLAIAGATRGETPALTAGVEHAIAVVDDTAAAVAADVAFAPRPENADPIQARQLANNHSFADHSSPDHPGYNDCDSWRNIIFDGWSASDALVASGVGNEEAQRLLAAAGRYWRAQGHTVAETTYHRESGALWVTRLSVSDDLATYRFDIDWLRSDASISATTRCLAPD